MSGKKLGLIAVLFRVVTFSVFCFAVVALIILDHNTKYVKPIQECTQNNNIENNNNKTDLVKFNANLME